MNYREQLFKCYDIYFEKYANQAAVTLAHKKYVLDGFLRMLPDDVSDITTAAKSIQCSPQHFERTLSHTTAVFDFYWVSGAAYSYSNTQKIFG